MAEPRELMDAQYDDLIHTSAGAAREASFWRALRAARRQRDALAESEKRLRVRLGDAIMWKEKAEQERDAMEQKAKRYRLRGMQCVEERDAARAALRVALGLATMAEVLQEERERDGLRAWEEECCRGVMPRTVDYCQPKKRRSPPDPAEPA